MERSSFNLHLVENFFDAEVCRELITEMRSADAAAALTYGKGEAVVDERVRQANRLSVSQESVVFVSYQLEKQRGLLAKVFQTELAAFEEPEFLCYRVGDFFVAHQDGNTGLVNLDTDRRRRISVSIFLNTQSRDPRPESYCGGSLIFSDWRTNKRQEVVGQAGMLLAFPSETTHEVTPVTYGERYAIVSWYGVSD